MLSVVIVNYNVKYYVGQCLDSLKHALQGIDAEILVVDNHSKDGSVEYLQPYLSDNCRLISMNHNVGFAKGNNVAIRQAKGDYILLLNPDTVVGEDVIADVLRFMQDHDDAGAVGVCMHYCDGRKAPESRRGLPTPMTAFYKMTGLCRRFPNSKRYGKYYMAYLPWDEACKIDVVSGAFCMLRKRALDEVGLLDEDFFMYGEDIDLSYRLLKGGYTNWYVPTSILHYKGESTEKSSFRYVHVFYQAMLIFFRKHYGHLSFLLSIPIKIAIYIKALSALVSIFRQWLFKFLGLHAGKKEKQTVYHFFGLQEHADDFKQLAQKKGLSYVIHTVTDEDKSNGHLSLLGHDTIQKPTIIVYDTAAYSYATMLRLFAEQPMDNVELGIYHPQQQLLITEKEILV